MHIDTKQVAAQSGATLLETVITITIISILSVMVVSAFPNTRDNEALVTDTELIRSYMREAQRKAINEVRSQECLDKVGDDNEAQKTCSNIGVGLQGNHIVMFADIAGSARQYNEGSDHILQEGQLQGGVQTQHWISYVFEAAPPTVTLFANGATVGPDAPAELTLAAGNITRSLTIEPYGIIEVNE